VGRVNHIACIGLLLLMSTRAGASGIVSTVSSASDDVVVLINASVGITLSPYTRLPAGPVPGDFGLGTFSANTTGGTLAVRVNRDINPAVPGQPGTVHWGQATNSKDPAGKINFRLVLPSSAALQDGWQVLAQGETSLVNSPIQTYLPQRILPGTYPLAVDVVAFSY